MWSVNAMMDSSEEDKTNKDQKGLFLRLIPFYSTESRAVRRQDTLRDKVRANMKHAALFLTFSR